MTKQPNINQQLNEGKTLLGKKKRTDSSDQYIRCLYVRLTPFI
jgi:hypothetical protein